MQSRPPEVDPTASDRTVSTTMDLSRPGYQPQHDGPADGRLAVALAAVLFVGFVIRSLATLLPPLIVGPDGAYYLVQVRAILRSGVLPVLDFPLLFYFQACLAGLLSLVAEQHTAIIAAVRLTDTFLPLALAVPVFQFARSFLRCGGCSGGGVIAVALVGLMAVASGHALLMAGGMIKNATALPASFLFAFAVYSWLCGGRKASLAWALFWFLLALLIHMGGFILSATWAASIIIVGLTDSAVRQRLWRPAILLLTCLAACLAIISLLDQDRSLRLIHAVVSPGWLFSDSPFLLWLRGSSNEFFSSFLDSVAVWLGIVLSALGVFALWRYRASIDSTTRVVLIASMLVTLVFSLPLFRPDVNERLALLAYVPGMIPVVYLLCRVPKSAIVVVPITLVVMLQGALAVKTLRQTALAPAAHQELIELKSSLPPGRTIVITQPLLRWWVVWTMDTYFSAHVEPALAARDKYDEVLVLDQVRSGVFRRLHDPPGLGGLGAGIADAALLQSETVMTIAQGEYFRLSRVIVSPAQQQIRLLQ